jgi:hypothetical protein
MRLRGNPAFVECMNNVGYLDLISFLSYLFGHFFMLSVRFRNGFLEGVCWSFFLLNSNNDYACFGIRARLLSAFAARVCPPESLSDDPARFPGG